MTEFCEAVAYAVYYVGLEGLNTSFKTEEALINVYIGWSYSRVVFASSSLRHHTFRIACTDSR